MKIVSIFDAARDGTFEEFKLHFKNSSIDAVNHYVDMNLLCLVVTNDVNYQDKIKIVKFLISKGVDINFTSSKDRRNALHVLFYSNKRSNIKYLIEITKLLVENGIEVNAEDKYEAIPLKYAITLNKLPTDELKELYMYLLKKGSNYTHKDEFNKSCLDYAKEYSWRNGFIEIVEEYKRGT